MAPLARPETSTGVALCGTLGGVGVAVPSSPAVLSPQHVTPPALVSAQVWRAPAAIAETPPVRPTTSTGALTTQPLLVQPLPIGPAPFAPQHFTPPVMVTTQTSPPLAPHA